MSYTLFSDLGGGCGHLHSVLLGSWKVKGHLLHLKQVDTPTFETHSIQTSIVIIIVVGEESLPIRTCMLH